MCPSNSDKVTSDKLIFVPHEYTLREAGESLSMHYSAISVIGKRIAESRKHQE